jgi:valyl-tRNA synthetase
LVVATPPAVLCDTPHRSQDATLNANAGKYAGMDRFKARKALWADMEAAGLTLKKDPYTVR